MRGKIIDIHAHIWRGRVREDSALLLRAAERFGIGAIFVSALGSHVPDEEEVRELNDMTGALLREESIFRGYVTVSPEHGNALDVLKRGVEEQGMLGMKLWVSRRCDDACCDRLYRYCADEGVPVLVHTYAKTAGMLPGESTAAELRRAALRFPEVRFIMAHLGGNCYHGVPLIRDVPNVWADFSGSNCREDDLPYAVSMLGAGRILFGTDMPGACAMSLGQALGAGLSEGELELILRRNAAELFPKGGLSDVL